MSIKKKKMTKMDQKKKKNKRSLGVEVVERVSAIHPRGGGGCKGDGLCDPAACRMGGKEAPTFTTQ